MENMEFDVLFKGEVAKGFKISDVKDNLASAFKLPPDKIDRLFSGKSVSLKKSISSEKAMAFQQSLLKMGVVSHVAPAHIEQHIENKALKNKSAFSLEPMARTSVANRNIGTIPEDVPDQIEAKRSFEFPSISPMAILLLVSGLSLLFLFSPYPDYVIRKGFLLGIVFLFFGLRKLRV